jgi:hypothetical protein
MFFLLLPFNSAKTFYNELFDGPLDKMELNYISAVIDRAAAEHPNIRSDKSSLDNYYSLTVYAESWPTSTLDGRNIFVSVVRFLAQSRQIWNRVARPSRWFSGNCLDWTAISRLHPRLNSPILGVAAGKGSR